MTLIVIIISLITLMYVEMFHFLVTFVLLRQLYGWEPQYCTSAFQSELHRLWLQMMSHDGHAEILAVQGQRKSYNKS